MNLKQNINRVKKNKDAKVLLSNFGYLTALQIASYIFPLLTLPYLAKVLGVNNFGKIAFASAIIIWFKTVVDWGFDFTATRDVAKNRDNPKIVSHIFSNVFWTKCILMFFSFLILLLLIFTIPEFQENKAIILMTFLTIPGYVMYPSWFFQAIEKMKFITILDIVSKLFFTIAVFVFIKEKSDFIFQPLLISLGFSVSGVFAMYLILFKWKIRLKKPKWSDMLMTLKGSFDVFINNLMPNFYSNFSVFLLGIFGGTIATGKLDAGSKFINMSQQFIRIITRTFYPYLSRKIDKHNLYAKLNIIISLSISIVLFILAPLLIRLFFTPEFYDSIIVLRIMSISILFITLSSIYGVNYLIIKGYEQKLRNITIVSSMLGFFLSFPLVYYFSFVGAAITITLSRGLLGISTMFAAKRIEKTQKLDI